MKQFLVISTGDSAATAAPLLATSDAEVIAAAMDALLERAGVLPDTAEANAS